MIPSSLLSVLVIYSDVNIITATYPSVYYFIPICLDATCHMMHEQCQQLNGFENVVYASLSTIQRKIGGG